MQSCGAVSSSIFVIPILTSPLSPSPPPSPCGSRVEVVEARIIGDHRRPAPFYECLDPTSHNTTSHHHEPASRYPPAESSAPVALFCAALCPALPCFYFCPVSPQATPSAHHIISYHNCGRIQFCFQDQTFQLLSASTHPPHPLYHASIFHPPVY